MSMRIKKGLRSGGLTSAAGSALTRNGRGCRLIEAVNATMMPRGVALHSVLSKEIPIQLGI